MRYSSIAVFVDHYRRPDNREAAKDFLLQELAEALESLVKSCTRELENRELAEKYCGSLKTKLE